jgi:anaerobic magnesium-protoporphyrin IX monomethyl ester cyclase
MKVSLIRARHHNIWEPLNLMYLSAYLKIKIVGLEVTILDCFFDSDATIISKVSDSDFVGLTGATPQLTHMLELSKKIKEQHGNVKLILGGFGVSLQPHKVIEEKHIDYIVLGEGEKSISDIVTGNTARIVSNTPIADIDSIPFPDRDCLNLENYINIAKKEEGRRVTSILTARGCPYGCTFCAEGKFGTIWRKIEIKSNVCYGNPVKLRLRSAKSIVQEMKQIKDRYKIEFIKTSDAETNPTKRHFLNICKEIHRQRLDVPWGCNMRADKIDEEVCEWAIKANCREFSIGIESGVEEIHKHMHKDLTLKSIRKVFKLTRHFGIKSRAYVLIGTPLETFETIKRTETLVDEIQPDIIGISILCPYPGTIYWRNEFDSIDWGTVDEYANTMWGTMNLSNTDLRNEQARLLTKYNDKLAVNFRKKFENGIINRVRNEH